MVVERGFRRKRGGCVLGGASPCPLAFFGAFVGVFGAVVEAVCSGGLLVDRMAFVDEVDGMCTLYNFHSGKEGSQAHGNTPSGNAPLLLLRRRPSLR